ncbi:hypothetical protein ACFQ4O_14120, partial [Methylopila musalis]
MRADAPLSSSVFGGLDPLRAVEALAPAIAATAERHDREASLPLGNLRALHDAGLLALTAPQA